MVDIIWAIRRFGGKKEGTLIKEIRYMFSDGSDEFVAACRQLGIKHDTSAPGKPQENSFIERQVQTVIRGTRAALRASGLPLACWLYAAGTYCHLRNMQREEDGESPWSRRFKRSNYY